MAEIIQIPAPNIQMIEVEIKGTTPLMFHKWSEKAKAQIRDKQQKKAKTGRPKREPEVEYLNSFYYTQDGFVSFPALAIKQAIVGAARSIDGLQMTIIRGNIFVVGDVDGLVPVLVDGKPVKPSKKLTPANGTQGENIFAIDTANTNLVMMEHMVRVARGAADLRYRGAIKSWSMNLMVKFNADMFSQEQVVNLIQTAGFSQGLGEWRPERNGDSGTFEVVQS
jgi:hypothetical protein